MDVDIEPLCGAVLMDGTIEYICRDRRGHNGNHSARLCGDTSWKPELKCGMPHGHEGVVHACGSARWDNELIRQHKEAEAADDRAYERAYERLKLHAETVPGGATREVRNTDYSQLSHVALRLMAETQGEGNAKYGYGNWQKGIPVSNLLSHAMEHILKLQNGHTDENHLGHALWNLEKAAHFIETRPELVDVLPMRKAMGLDEPSGPPHITRRCKACGMYDYGLPATGGCVRGKAHDFAD